MLWFGFNTTKRTYRATTNWLVQLLLLLLEAGPRGCLVLENKKTKIEMDVQFKTTMTKKSVLLFFGYLIIDNQEKPFFRKMSGTKKGEEER